MKFTITNLLEHSTNVNMNITFGNISLEEALSIINAIESKIGLKLSDMDKEIVALIKAGTMLQAVKYHKEKTGFV